MSTSLVPLRLATEPVARVTLKPMSRCSVVLVGIVVLFGLAIADCKAQGGEPRDYILPSWGDLVYCYGPGVDPALDSPEAFEQMIKYWKGRGFKGVFLRTDLGQLDPATFRRNPVAKRQNPREAVALKYIDEVMDRFPVQAVADAISDKNGMEFWAWHAHTFSDGAPETAGAPGPYRIWPWSYASRYTFEHPDALTTDRTQTKHQWMVREYGYPEARATKVAEFVYMARKFGVRRFVVENRSEASQVQDPPDNADRFGFNDVVVKDMKQRYGVDILTDPRFDVDSPKFNALDPMVENWHRLRGGYFTQFFRDLRKALNAVDPKIRIAASLAGERIGPPMGNWFTDWRTWVDEGLVDAIVSPCDFDAYPTSAKILKTYITCAKQGRGIVPLKVLRDYINKSKHPQIRIISSGGSFFFPNPPTDGDAWRTTDWYDSYQLAWYQRWKQLMRDLDEFGYIKFLDQSFDSFPVDSSYYSGGWGNKGYVPSLRACPGCWLRMGPVNGTLPSVQSQIHYGDKGNAVKLTSDPTKSTGLLAYHSGTFDRSLYYACIEPAILNGKADFEFRIFRDSDDSSIAVCFQDGTDVQNDIGVRVVGGRGAVCFSRSGVWVESGASIPKRQWEQIRISVDLDKLTYSASVVSDQAKVICRDIAVAPPKPRRIQADDGSGRTVEARSYKMLNQLDFAPQGKTGSITYLDDVAVRWRPTIPYDKPGKNVLFAEDFERFGAGDPMTREKPLVGERWSVAAGNPKEAVIENAASYGQGVHSLSLQGHAQLECVPAKPAKAATKVVLDVDVFVRSDAYYVTIMPNSGTKTRQVITLGLADDREADLVAIKNANGEWSYLADGQYKKSSIPVALDCWNHVQISLDPASGAYKIVIQPVGELPAVLATGSIPSGHASGCPRCIIKTDAPDDALESRHGSDVAIVNCACVDNVQLTGD